MIHAYATKVAGGSLEEFDYDPGALKSEEVEIKVEYCGICHSDLSMLQNDWGVSQYPFVPAASGLLRDMVKGSEGCKGKPTLDQAWN